MQKGAIKTQGPQRALASQKCCQRKSCWQGGLSRQRQCVREEDLSDEREAKREISSHLELNRHIAVKLWSDTWF